MAQANEQAGGDPWTYRIDADKVDGLSGYHYYCKSARSMNCFHDYKFTSCDQCAYAS